MVDRRILPEGPPLVVAHRGASVAQPENTLAAFEAAVATGAEILELDVRLSADGVPVVVHDPDVARSTNGHGLVHEMTLRELKELDAAPGSAEIPTLGEVLDLATGRVGIDLEIKNIPGEPGFDSPREATVEATVRELERVAFSGDVLISSFNWLSIERSRELAPAVSTGFLTIGVVEGDAALVYAQGAGHDWILPQVDAVVRAGPGLLDEAHGAGIRVGTWVVDDEESLRRLFQWRIDAVATNDPELAIRVRG
jgi:glycerophosphoryl diester phosphodiesterase